MYTSPACCPCSLPAAAVFIHVLFNKNGRHLPSAALITHSGPPPPRPPPDHYPRLHHDETAPYRILLWVWVVIRGLAGRCFTVGDRCPTPLPPPPPPHPTQCQHRCTQIQQLWQQTKTICIQQYPTGSRYNEINKSETQRFRGETLVRPKIDMIRSDKRLKIKSNQMKEG